MKKKIFVLISMLLLVFALTSCEKKIPKEETKEVSKYVLKEEEASFRFFWETQVIKEGKAYGLIPDRYPSNGLASIASVGFGLAAIPVGVQNDWITEDEGRQRVISTLKSIDNLSTIEGFYYHFYSDRTGNPSTGSEISNIDTAILIAGAIMAGEYFQGEAKELANKILNHLNSEQN